MTRSGCTEMGRLESYRLWIYYAAFLDHRERYTFLDYCSRGFKISVLTNIWD